MPRAGYTHILANTSSAGFDDAYQRISAPNNQAIALPPNCTSMILAAETAAVFVTFDDTAASATNGLPIISGAQPVYIPLGKNAHSSGQIRAFSATGVLHVLLLS